MKPDFIIRIGDREILFMQHENCMISQVMGFKIYKILKKPKTEKVRGMGFEPKNSYETRPST
jgi:hypothetical protein